MGEQVAAGFTHGGVAQLGEHLPCKQGVMSSNLTISIRCVREAEASRSERTGSYFENRIKNRTNIKKPVLIEKSIDTKIFENGLYQYAS